MSSNTDKGRKTDISVLKLACVVDVIQTLVSNVCKTAPNWILLLAKVPLPVSHTVKLRV